MITIKATIQSPQSLSAMASDSANLVFNALEGSKWMPNSPMPPDHMLQMIENFVFLIMLTIIKHSIAVSYPFAPDQNLFPLMAKLTQSDTSFSVANVTSQNSVSEEPVPPVNDVPASAPTRDSSKYC